ncbi:glycosyltransferase family 2 protein [Bacillus smithii]|uniref:glycosyltransferase family 2 protein n=1 Tax=Bacillus smithii TaxID=1479 RepID=UPI002E24A0B1|nr:glycosyltransferase family 2 protein [Bacillus smithii]MED1456799.1 glycosyltransferase family 2 protein [Bacillus smithii]
MANELAIIICNWNKKDYVLKCIESVKKSTFKDYDLFVVDNASTDGSVEAIQQQFGNTVNLIINKENKGGSGGFNTGIREALKNNYRYIQLLDNDVIVDKKAIEELYNYMENNPNTAVAGSKIYVLDQPNKIQEIGAKIDYKKYTIHLNYANHLDVGNLPEVVECDYVPACSMMVRVDVIRKVGLMDEEYFLYWDDIDWCYRMKLRGYRVVALNKSKIWHKSGVKVRQDTLTHYYFFRNRVYFFMKFLNSEDGSVNNFVRQLIQDLAESMYFGYKKQRFSTSKTLLYAIEDSLANIRGKAQDGRIFVKELEETPIEKYVKNIKSNIALIFYKEDEIYNVGDLGPAVYLASIIRKMNKNIDITVVLDSPKNYCEWLNSLKIEGINVIHYSEFDRNKFEHVAQYLHHLSKIHKSKVEKDVNIYIDGYQNCIISNEDKKYAENYREFLKTLEETFLPVLLNRFREIAVKIKRI